MPRLSFRRTRGQASVVTPHAAKEWLQTRFDELLPEDVIPNMPYVVYSMQNGMPPSQLQHIWKSIATHHRVGGILPADERHLVLSAKVLLVLADLRDKIQVQDMNHLCHSIEQCFENQECPHVIVLQHCMTPSPRREIDELTQTKVLFDSLRSSIDIVTEEVAGFELAWAVQNRLLRQNVRTSQVQKRRDGKRSIVQKINKIDGSIDYSLWTYARLRLGINLPPIDPNIEPGEAAAVDGFEVASVLGKGACGTVYKLKRDRNGVEQVLKAMPKSSTTSVRGVKALGQVIHVMELLSSKSWKHPNIIQLLGIHHSTTHVYFRLLDGGPRDLHARLRHRDNRHSPLSLLSSRKVKSIISQVSSAVSHMHNGPEIAHFDLKPENIIVSETSEDIHVSISDFDLAVVRPSLACRGVVGTFPFIAPEVFFQDTYNPFAADVWSMAVIFLEVVCRSKVLEKALHLHSLPDGSPGSEVRLNQQNMTGEILHYFSEERAINSFLERNIHPRLRDMMDTLLSILLDMLVEQSSRASSSKVAKAVCQEQHLSCHS